MDRQTDSCEARWASEQWRAAAVGWLDEQLAAAGRRRTGAVQQPRLRPWSTVLTAPTSQGRVWLKACAPDTAFEVGLYAVLARVAPQRVLTPIAVDLRRSWVLLPDGGPPLGDRLKGDDLVEALVTILPRYAQLQRDLAPECATLLALGVSDMRPAIMPQRLEEALDATAERGDPAMRDQLAAMRGTFASWCRRLAGLPGAPSIDHNDLHPHNMLVRRLDRPQAVRFYDWGDAVVAHPFASMLVPLSWVRDRLGLSLDSPPAIRMRDAYLAVFDDLATPAELVHTLELACHVGKVARALVWERAVRSAAPGDHDELYGSGSLLNLRALLDDSHAGGV
jgi:phosphotransferase family enzyme